MSRPTWIKQTEENEEDEEIYTSTVSCEASFGYDHYLRRLTDTIVNV